MAEQGQSSRKRPAAEDEETSPRPPRLNQFEAHHSLDTSSITSYGGQTFNSSQLYAQDGSITFNNYGPSCLHDDKPSHSDFLESLRYRSIEYRYDSIVEAHCDTFQWALDKTIYPDLIDWVRSNRSFFWIRGKPGCGKSTLMKLLVESAAMHQHIQHWASSAQSPVITKMFFWKSGTEMQRSQHGLFQSMLLDVLSQRQDLIDQVFTVQQQRRAVHSMKYAFDQQYLFWQEQEIFSAFQRLQKVPDWRAFAFIDGLDEYNGNPIGFAKMLLTLQAHGHFKILAAGRPLQEHVIMFQPFKSLIVHEYTKRDIAEYVEGRLYDDPDIKTLHPSLESFRSLKSTILERAQGVFTWLKLAIDSIIEGIIHGEDEDALLKRLRELPEDLFDLYAQMLRGMNERHRAVTAKLLLMYASICDLPELVVSSESTRRPNLILSLASCDQFTGLAEINDLIKGPQYLQEKQREIAKCFLRCPSMFEILSSGYNILSPEDAMPLFNCYHELFQSHRKPKRMLGWRGWEYWSPYWDIQPMHATVREFLQDINIKKMLESWAGQDAKYEAKALEAWLWIWYLTAQKYVEGSSFLLRSVWTLVGRWLGIAHEITSLHPKYAPHIWSWFKEASKSGPWTRKHAGSPERHYLESLPLDNEIYLHTLFSNTKAWEFQCNLVCSASDRIELTLLSVWVFMKMPETSRPQTSIPKNDYVQAILATYRYILMPEPACLKPFWQDLMHAYQKILTDFAPNQSAPLEKAARREGISASVYSLMEISPPANVFCSICSPALIARARSLLAKEEPGLVAEYESTPLFILRNLPCLDSDPHFILHENFLRNREKFCDRMRNKSWRNECRPRRFVEESSAASLTAFRTWVDETITPLPV